MGSSLFSIGLTGLNAAQAGLITTSHNISNAGTAGYSRQNTVQSTNPAMFTGAGFFGEGTRVDTVKRAYNAFLNNQVLAADTKYNEYDTYSTEIAQIDNMLADASVGLSPALESFFGGVQEVAANPSSIPARQSMISTAQSLVSRLRNLSERLDEVRGGLESQIGETVGAISTYAKNIAEVNNKIMVAQQAGSAQPANDLLDTRDQLIQELNQLVRVSTNVDSDGAMSIFIGTGQPLVVGSTATTLKALPSIADPSRLDANILTQNGGAIAIPESLLGGGKLGGLLAMRSGALDSAQNQLGLIAVGIGTAFNAQHALGQDLNGKLGGDFFNQAEVSVTRYSNASTAFPAVDFTDVSKLSGDDYKLTFTDTVGSYTLKRVSDGAAVSAADVGLSITPASTSMVGDSFLIQPTRHAAGNFEVTLTDTRMVAAAAPLSARAGSTGLLSTTASNGATAISAPTIWSNDRLANLDAANSVFTYNAGTGNLDPSGLPSGTLVSYTNASGSVVGPAAAASIPYTSGMTVALWHTGSSGNVKDVSFSISGAPANGNTFLLGGGSSNLGTASISAPVVTNTQNLASLQAGLTTLNYNSSANTLSVNNLPSGMRVAYTPLNGTQQVSAPGTPVPYTSGMSIAFGHTDTSGAFVQEVSFAVSGAPQNADRFAIGANTSGVSDSRNAVLLGKLQTTKTLLSANGQPSASFQSVYSQLVSSVGNKAREVNVNRDAQESLVEQATAAQKSAAGVNLDEEAANLIRYQQAYQAAGKVMSIASKLFDQVLSLGA
jgi:flagellar hook-associated protein 1 FlgK